ncbi:MAG: hypothetical protein K2Z81_00235 [Cyanobacteria bacterium]|nr:hypothetical protein [Cyanobacteriota bacterium]
MADAPDTLVELVRRRFLEVCPSPSVTLLEELSSAAVPFRRLAEVCDAPSVVDVVLVAPESPAALVRERRRVPVEVRAVLVSEAAPVAWTGSLLSASVAYEFATVESVRMKATKTALSSLLIIIGIFALPSFKL